MDRIAHLYQSRLWSCRLRTFGGILASIGLTIGVGKFCDLIELQASTTATTPGPVSGQKSSVSTAQVSSTETLSATPSSSTSATVSQGPGSGSTAVDSAEAMANPVWSSLTTSIKSWFRENPKQALMIVTGMTSTIITGLLTTFQSIQLTRYATSLTTRESIDRVIQEVIKKDHTSMNVNSQDEHLQAMSEHVLSYLPQTLSHGGVEMIENLSRMNANDTMALDRIQSVDIANLRRRASPSFPHLSPPPKVNLSTPMKEQREQQTETETEQKGETQEENEEGNVSTSVVRRIDTTEIASPPSTPIPTHKNEDDAPVVPLPITADANVDIVEESQVENEH
jgi:hypothetical protein